ncbi:MAG: hypothetical protein KUL88_04620 [Rhizobium sp.]|nr:hypothetical protein [Rhizobium sp.]
MPRTVALWLVVFGAFLCLFTPQAMAGSSDAQQSMRDFLKEEPNCLEFTDQCSICRRDGETVMCSTPSIACIRTDYVCTKTDAKGQP